MAVFPKRPDSETDVKAYLHYMVERIEFSISNLEKEILTLKKQISDNGGNDNG